VQAELYPEPEAPDDQFWRPLLLAVLAELDRQELWRRDAGRREHPELEWFPPRGQNAEAQRPVCAGCPVPTECFEYALRQCSDGAHLPGVSGGKTYRDRREARRRTLRALVTQI
jgi:hypothetical protein